MICKKCAIDKPEHEFTVYRIIKNTPYYNKSCKQCRRKPGVKIYISPDDEKKILVLKDDYGKIHGSEFYEKAGLKMPIQSFYRYGRLGIIDKILEKKDPV